MLLYVLLITDWATMFLSKSDINVYYLLVMFFSKVNIVTTCTSSTWVWLNTLYKRSDASFVLH